MDETNGIRITVLGTRGSVPVSGEAVREFGGATSCYLVEAAGQAIYLDAGTGILNAPPLPEDDVSILLSHTHLDHILGLPFFPPLSQEGRRIHIYAKNRDGKTTEEQLARFLSPPLWPCGLSDYPGGAACHELTTPLRLGSFTVDDMESTHPGGCTVYRLRCGGRTVVCATDFEHDEHAVRRLTAFAKDADLLMYDGQYTEWEYRSRRGFGHSTAEAGLRVFRDSGAKRLLIIHHDPCHTDEMLRDMEAPMRSERVRFAREGDVIYL